MLPTQLRPVFPRPTGDQVEAFVEFVVRAHTWYKHLPWSSPGLPFLFFLNPGVVRVHDGESSSSVESGWQPSTLELDRERLEGFGHLAYYVYRSDRRVTFEGPDSRWLDVPDAIHTLGTVY